jgi:hypothetical protein
VREHDPVGHGDDLQGSFLDASVAPVLLGVRDRDIAPGQLCELLAQLRLVVFDGEQVMGSALFYQMLGGLPA